MERHIADSRKQEDAVDALPAVSEEQAQPAIKISPVAVFAALAVVVVLLVAGGMPRILQNRALVEKKNAEIHAIPSVAYVVAKGSEPIQEFVLPGSTQAILYAPVYARVDGYLHKLYVNIGDHVQAGEVMADIDTPELDNQVATANSNVTQAIANLDNTKQALSKAQADARTASANVQKAKSDLAYAEVQFQRYKQLSSQGAVSLEDKDTRLTNYNGALATLQAVQSSQKSAEAQINSAVAAVNVANAAVQSARSQRDQYASTRAFKKVTAQFNGSITRRNVDPGALVTSGSSSNNSVLFEIAQTDTLRIFAYVPEQYIAAVHQGDQAALTFASYPGERFIGTVSYIAGGLDPNSRTLQVEIHVPNLNHKLLPGMYAQVHFKSPSPQRLAVIPGSAVQTRADGTFVYTFDDGNVVHSHRVQIANDLGGQVEIASGLSPGDKVIISPSDGITEGVRVEAVLLPLDRSDKQK